MDIFVRVEGNRGFACRQICTGLLWWAGWGGGGGEKGTTFAVGVLGKAEESGRALGVKDRGFAL